MRLREHTATLIYGLLGYCGAIGLLVVLAMLIAGCTIPNGVNLAAADGTPGVTVKGAAASLKSGTIEQDAWRFSGNTADTQALSGDARGLYVAGGGVVRGIVIDGGELGQVSIGGMSTLGVRGFRYTIDATTGKPLLEIDSVDDDTIGVTEAMVALEAQVGVRFSTFTEAQKTVFVENFNDAMATGRTLIEALERAYAAAASLGASEISAALTPEGGEAPPIPGGD